MLEEVEPGEEVTSMRRPSPTSSIVTESCTDYDPTEPSEWESESFEEDQVQPFKKKEDSGA